MKKSIPTYRTKAAEMRKVNPPTIISIAANLLTIQLSDNPEDYPKSMPKWVVKMIEQHNIKQQNWAYELKLINDNLKKSEASGG